MAFAIPVYKKGKGQSWEIQTSNLHWSPWEYYVTSFQEVIPWHVNDKISVINNQHGFTNKWFYQQIMPNRLVDFYDINGGPVNTTARVVDVIYLNHSQAFIMVSHNILQSNWRDKHWVGGIFCS